MVMTDSSRGSVGSAVTAVAGQRLAQSDSGSRMENRTTLKLRKYNIGCVYGAILPENLQKLYNEKHRGGKKGIVTVISQSRL